MLAILGAFVSIASGCEINEKLEPKGYSTVSADSSTVVLSASSATVSATSSVTATVTVKNSKGKGLSDQFVLLRSNRGDYDSVQNISNSEGRTDSSGQVQFSIKSIVAGDPTFTATVLNQGLTISQKPTLSFTADSADPDNSVYSSDAYSDNGVNRISVTAAAPSSIDSFTLTVSLYDSVGPGGGNIIETGGSTVYFYDLGGSSGVLTPALSTTPASSVLATDNGDGTYSASFTATTDGTINIGVEIDGVATTTSTFPILIDP